MPIPTYGAAPLAKTFLWLRILQIICFLGIIGITADFISEIVASDHVAPHEIIGTVTMASLAALYTLTTLPFFYSRAHIGLLIMTLFDFLLLLTFTIISVVLGKPLATLQCPLISGDPLALLSLTDAYDFTEALSSSVGDEYGSFVSWAGANKKNCYGSKGAWGLCVALCILFAMSMLVLPALFAKKKRALRCGEKV